MTARSVRTWTNRSTDQNSIGSSAAEVACGIQLDQATKKPLPQYARPANAAGPAETPRRRSHRTMKAKAAASWRSLTKPIAHAVGRMTDQMVSGVAQPSVFVPRPELPGAPAAIHIGTSPLSNR